MPDAVPLHSLLLPGTHDTMAFYGWIISQCQSLETPLQVQLQNGIRVLDIRLAKIEGKLIAYHGVYPEKTPFQTILSAVHEFLTSPISCRETIVMSIKQEDSTSTPPPVFSRLVRDEFASGPGGLGILFLENRIPTLGEVRGKVVFLSRFGGDGAEWENGLEGMGIHPTIWPDSEKDGFTWECKDVLVRTHDCFSSHLQAMGTTTTTMANPINATPPQPALFYPSYTPQPPLSRSQHLDPSHKASGGQTGDSASRE
ncbi:hypothetical protein HHX47_DHR1001047 [Lentinula edodes]|nr:hypothetical protein HHX47_DHR1001047 [Lentinula edodes]